MKHAENTIPKMAVNINDSFHLFIKSNPLSYNFINSTYV
jgi:hypothetical protein